MPNLELDELLSKTFEAPEELSAVPEIELHEDNAVLQVRQAEVVVVRAKRRQQGGVLRLATIRDIPIFTGRASVQDPNNICSTVPGSKGKLLVYSDTPDGRAYYFAPNNFSFQQMQNTVLVVQRNALSAKTAATESGLDGNAAYWNSIVNQFVAIVRPGGPFDWKVTGTGRNGVRNAPIRITDQGQLVPIFEPFGNWAFGYFGAALGFSEDFLVLGASAAQFADNLRRTTFPKFDDARDVNNIKAGAKAFNDAYKSAADSDTSPTPVVAFVLKC